MAKRDIDNLKRQVQLNQETHFEITTEEGDHIVGKVSSKKKSSLFSILFGRKEVVREPDYNTSTRYKEQWAKQNRDKIQVVVQDDSDYDSPDFADEEVWGEDCDSNYEVAAEDQGEEDGIEKTVVRNGKEVTFETPDTENANNVDSWKWW